MPRARYGVEMLLLGLGLAPQWTDRAALDGGGLYYGTAPEDAPAGALRLRLAPETAEALARPALPDPAAVSALAWRDRRWPLLHPAGRAFGAPAPGAVVEADVVASAFAWLSGALEAAVTARDIHARLPAGLTPTAALAAARPDLADPAVHPPVEAYRAWLGSALARHGVGVPGRTWGGRAWAVAPTLDVDLVRTRRPGAVVGRDPRRARLAELMELLVARDAAPTVFLMAGASADYDVPYGLGHPTLRPVWDAARAGRAEVGLHPSYFAHDHPARLGAEHARLRAAAAREGTAAAPVVRTHFLRWTEPATPRTLAGAGFALDASLGFSTRVGYRRGTAAPFRLYDLAADRPLDLWAVPLAAMDTALLVHRGAGADEARASLDAVLDGAREAGGCAVLLWHNEPLGPAHLALLAGALDRARDGGAFVGGVGAAVAAWQPA